VLLVLEASHGVDPLLEAPRAFEVELFGRLHHLRRHLVDELVAVALQEAEDAVDVLAVFLGRHVAEACARAKADVRVEAGPQGLRRGQERVDLALVHLALEAPPFRARRGADGHDTAHGVQHDAG